MNIVKTICPECAAPLEFPADFDNVVCSGCGATHQVREHNGTLSLRVVRSGPVDWEDRARVRDSVANIEEPTGIDEAALAELEELITEVESDIEAARAREQSGPLQMGCAAFGVFGLVLTVIVAFMLVGRSLVGGWVFYLALALVTIIGIARIRRKLKSQTPAAEFRADRLRLEETLAELESERARLTGGGAHDQRS
jgi:exonuclease VII small subunit